MIFLQPLLIWSPTPHHLLLLITIVTQSALERGAQRQELLDYDVPHAGARLGLLQPAESRAGPPAAAPDAAEQSQGEPCATALWTVRAVRRGAGVPQSLSQGG